MGTLFDYTFGPFLAYVWPLVTAGGLFGFDEIARRWWPAARRILDNLKPERRRKLEIAALILGVFYAGFAAWSDEHQAKQAEHDMRIAAEVRQNGPKPQRHLRQDQIQKLSQSIPDVFRDRPPNSFSLQVAAETPEAVRYALDFMSIIRAQKIQSFGPVTAFAGSESERGVMVGILDPAKPSITALRFIDALRDAGLGVTTTKWDAPIAPGQLVGNVDFELFVADQ